MALKTANRVSETTTTTGQGTLNLAGARTGFQTFVNGIGTTNTCYYSITDGIDWEIGLGTVTDATPDTLSRDVLIESTNATTFVNWGSGEKTVRCALAAPTYRVKVSLSSVQSIASGTSTGLTWTNGEEDYDEGSWHDGGGANPERFSLPAALAGRVIQASASIRFVGNATGRRRLGIYRYNSVSSLMESIIQNRPSNNPGAVDWLNVSGTLGPASTGDYFEVVVYQNSGGSLNVEPGTNNTHAEFEALMP